MRDYGIVVACYKQKIVVIKTANHKVQKKLVSSSTGDCADSLSS